MYPLSCMLFEMCLREHFGHMDDYDECEWSVCFPCVHHLSLLSSYGEDLSLRCRRWSCLSRGAQHHEGWQAQDASTPHFGSFDPLENAPCNRTFHFSWETGGLRNPHTTAHSPGTSPGPHNGVGPGGIGKSVSAKASSIILVGFRSLPQGRRQAAPSKSQQPSPHAPPASQRGL